MSLRVSLLALALTACATAPPEPPKDPRAAARLALDEGRLADVAPLLAPLARAGQASAEDLAVLAESWLRRGDGMRAYEAAAESLQRDPERLHTHEIAGLAASLLGQHAVAQEHLQLVATLPDVSPEVLGVLARLALETGTPEAAVAAARRAVDAGAPDALGTLADALARAGDSAGAQEALSRAIARAPDDAATRYHLGNLLAAKGDLPGAAAAFREALERDPMLVDAMRNLGSVLVMQDKGDEAITLLERAARIAPDSPEIQNNLGVAYARQGRADLAAKAFAQAVALAPDQPGIRANAAEALAQQGRLDEAIALLDPASPLLARLTIARALARAQCEGQTDAAALRARVARDLAAAGVPNGATRTTVEAILADPDALLAIDRAVERCRPRP
ncbi:MAG: hypothetical protein AMXMBFR64_11740 [Myxococcales bacterium]